jgi:tripartite-type tricarboxylate transporter receptor subunit TctC
VFLPAGAPPHVVARLESWFAEIVMMDSTKAFLANTHGASYPGGAKALAEFLPKEIKKWELLARLAKIKPQ